jgi:pSer/pThr/pTyr-binding forkhead associated (FHA) protein
MAGGTVLHPRLVVTASGVQIDLTGKADVLIGRADPVSGVFPDVDLTTHGGEEGGVSRKHAKLTLRGGQCTVEDLQSVNCTFVNSQKLNPGIAQPIKDGDQIRLGRVVLMFYTN